MRIKCLCLCDIQDVEGRQEVVSHITIPFDHLSCRGTKFSQTDLQSPPLILSTKPVEREGLRKKTDTDTEEYSGGGAGGSKREGKKI